MNDFLKDDALNYQNKRLGTTYLFFFGDNLVSYLTLTMCSIKAELMPSEDKIDGVVIREYPGIRIARLAVDNDYERRGLGTYMLLFAFGKACDLSQEIGCRFLVVDAKPEAVTFYEQNGFKLFKRQDKRRYPTLYFDCIHCEERKTGTVAPFYTAIELSKNDGFKVSHVFSV